MSNNNLPVWDLTRMYAAPERALADDWGHYAQEARGLCARAAECVRSKSLEDIKGILEDCDAIARKVDVARAYSYLYFSQDMLRENAGAFFQNMSEKLSDIDSVFVQIYTLFARSDASYLESLLDNADLSVYSQWVKRLLKAQPHTLEPMVEAQWVERSVVAGDAWRRLAQETLGKMEVVVGESATSLSGAMHKLRDADRKVREKALQGTIAALLKAESTLTFSFNTIAKEGTISSKWRGYKDVDSAMHQTNDTESEWVDALRTAIVQSYPKTSNELMNFRAAVLKVDTLEACDIHAPLLQEGDDLSWEESLQWIVGAYDELDPELGHYVRRMIDEWRLDMALRKGKEGGAFCYGTPEGPYVLTNYRCGVRDFLTLAHELGHAVHHFLSKDLPVATFRTSLILAEVASLFSEKLCIDYVLKHVTPEKKKLFMVHYVTDHILCVQGSINYDQFEKSMHVMRAETELTPDVLTKEWLKVRQQFFGERVSLPQEYGTLWSAIPHFFHTPFYVYSYAFSGLIMRALYSKKQESDFAEKYKMFLKEGGKMTFASLRTLFDLEETPQTFFKSSLVSLYDDVALLRRIIYDGAHC